jgi:hypothetical protein
VWRGTEVPGSTEVGLVVTGAGLGVCNGFYRLVTETPEWANGNPCFQNAHGAIIAWGDTDWTRKKGYPEGVGCWGVGYDGHHRYMARGDSPLPPTTGWVVREDPKWKYPSVAPMLRRNPAAASSKGEGAISGGGGAREALGPVVEARGEKLSAAAQAAEKLSNEAETFADLATQLRKANTGGFLGNFLAID